MVEGKRKGEVFLVDDPYQCALDVIDKCKPYTISSLKCKDSDVHSFIHPISGCIIEDGGDYEKRLEFCNELYKKINCYNFTFKNQSFAQMASQYQEIKFGKLYKKSSYTKEHMELLDRFYTTPLMRTLVKNHKPNDNCRGLFSSFFFSISSSAWRFLFNRSKICSCAFFVLSCSSAGFRCKCC